MRYRRDFRLHARDARMLEQELSEEMDAHLAMRVEELVARGESPERARALALERFGDRREVLASARQRERQLRRREWLGELRRDLVLTGRRAAHSPGATLLTLTTFALAIGLTTIMFAFVDRVLLRPLPFPAPERLVVLQGMDSTGAPVARTSYNDWADWRERSRSLAASAVHMERELPVAQRGRARYVPGQLVTAEFFDVLRPRLAWGRGFGAEDLDDGAVVVGEAYVQRELGGRVGPGTSLSLAGRVRPVVGVVQRGQEYPAGTEVWALTRGEPRGGGAQRNNINWTAIARLADGVTLPAAERELAAIARGIQATDPESDYSYGVTLLGLHDYLVGDVRGSLRLLLGAVGFVLLIACANLAALNLARGVQRRGEVAVRYALGASRGRMIRQLVTEQLALALLGGALGLLLAFTATDLLGAALADRVPRAAEVTVDLRIAAFTLALALIAGVLTGVAPAWRTSSERPRTLLGGRGAVRGGRAMPGAALVLAEVAMAVLLLAGAGLLLRSFQAVLARDVGFIASDRALAPVQLATERYEDESARAAFWDGLLAQLERDPDVAGAAIANWVPTGTGGTGYLNVEGRSEPNAGAAYRVIGEGYFAALGIPLLRGRDLETRDGPAAPRVAVISRSLAERYWPGENPVGRRIQVPGMEGYGDVPWLTIVGVAGDVRHDGHESEVSDHVYVSWRQRPQWTRAMTVVVRARADAASAGRAIVRAVQSLDRELAAAPVPLERELGRLVAERRLVMLLLSGFGAMALALAAVGLYGILSFAVAQRTREIGVRAALGASRSGIVRLVVLNAGRVVLAGAAIGMLAAYWLTRVLSGMLVDVTHADPLTYAAAALVLALVALGAALVPARRAARVDPLTALRAER